MEDDILLRLNTSLSSFSFAELSSIRIFEVKDNPVLKKMDLPKLKVVSELFYVQDNAEFPTCLFEEILLQIEGCEMSAGEPSCTYFMQANNNDDCTCESVGGETIASCP